VRKVRGPLVEDARRNRLADGEFDASDQGAVLSCKRNERAAGIDDGDIVGHSDACGLGFARFEHSLGV
jgi:hypothetical protein